MDTQKIGRFIAENRKKLNMTQVQLAEKLGVTGKTVSRWENGNYMPDLSLLQPLAEQLGITLNELLQGEYIPQEQLTRKAEENIRMTVDYSNSKIHRKQKAVISAVIICMFAMLLFGYQATRQNNIMYGRYDTAEQRRNRTFDMLQVSAGKDSVYWFDEQVNGYDFQVCIFVTDKKAGAFAIEKIDDKYEIAARTITTRAHDTLYEDDHILLCLTTSRNHERKDDIFVVWGAASPDKEVKFGDSIVEPIVNINGYNFWYCVAANVREVFEITVTEKEN